MIRARIRVKFQQERRKLFCNKPRMLKIDVSKKNEYLEELNRAFSQSEFDENNPDLDTIQRAMADSLIRTAKKFQLKRLSTSTKFSHVTLQLMKLRIGRGLGRYGPYLTLKSSTIQSEFFSVVTVVNFFPYPTCLCP